MKRLLLVFILLPVVFAAPIPDMRVALLNYDPSPVQPGQTINLYLEVSNDGNPTSGAWLELIEEYPFTILPSQDVERAKNLGIISGTQTLLFRIKVDPEVNDGTVPLRVRYAPGPEAGYQETELDIVIETFDARIGIASLKQIPERLAPGEEGELRIKLVNHDDRPLNNIDVLLDLTQSYDSSTAMNNILSVQGMINARLELVNRRVASGQSPLLGSTPMMSDDSGKSDMELAFKSIAPVGTTTLQRVSNLQPNEEVVISFPIQALPDAEPNIHAIPIYFNYNDEDNNPFHLRVEAPIVIDMESELFAQLKSSTLRSTDFAGDITILVANKGLSEIRYASIAMEASTNYTLLTAPEEVYLGTLAPGEAAEATFSLIPNTRDLELPITISFRDSFNRKMNVEEKLSLEVINKNYYRDMPYESMIVWIILGIVLFALTAFYVMSLRRKS